MKQTLAFIMAIAVLGTTLPTTALAADIKYPVGGISSKVYVTDEDGDLYLDNTSSKVSYGKTAYFPLLSEGSGALKEKYDEWKAAEKALEDARADLKTKKDAYEAAKAALDAYNTAEANHSKAVGAISTYDADYARLDKALTAAKAAVPAAQQEFNAKKALYDPKKDAYDIAKAAWDLAVNKVNGPEKVVLDSAVAALALVTPAYDAAKKTLDEKNGAVTTAQNQLTALGSKTGLQTDEKNKLTIKNQKAEALKSATGKSTVDAAKTAVETMLAAKTAAETAITPKERTNTEKKTAYEDATKNQYMYVYEPSAIKNYKISKKWEENGSYAADVDVVKKRVRSDITGATSSSMQSIYFLTVKIKSSTSTQDRDLLGRVTVKKSGSDGFEVSADIALEIGYSSASNTDAGEGVITRTPTTFKSGNGFEEEDDFTFEFDVDGDSRFVVNTVGQSSLVLSFNNDYDEKIEKQYPNADLWFYNGNYASFNRVGDLYLGYDNDDGYVYEISKNGQLTLIKPEYDEDEDAYKIRTRTLGRYVISDTKLKLTSTSSSSSSSSTGTGSGTGTGTGTGGTGTAVVPTSSTPSYTYTPPAASSSTAPPASSAASSSSSSEEPEESESEPEEELEDEDEIVDVVVDDDEVEGPDEKSGIPTWVWALIITGLAAVPVGIGVVYYLHSRPLRRDFFNKDEDGYEDEYDDEEDED